MINDLGFTASGNAIARIPRRYNAHITTNWPPAYRTIEGSLSPIPGSLLGTFLVSGPTICLPDSSGSILQTE